MVDLTGWWNDRDAEAAVAEVAEALLASAPLAALRQELGRAPTLELGPIRNRINEHLSMRALRERLAKALTATGEVDVTLLPESPLERTEAAAAKSQAAPPAELRASGMIAALGDVAPPTAEAGARRYKAYLLVVQATESASGEVTAAGVGVVRKLLTDPPPDAVGDESAPAQIKVTRLPGGHTLHLSKWLNDTDFLTLAQKTAEGIAKTEAFQDERPVIVIDSTANHSGTHFQGDLLRDLMIHALLEARVARLTSTGGGDDAGGRLRPTHRLRSSYDCEDRNGGRLHSLTFEVAKEEDGEVVWRSEVHHLIGAGNAKPFER